jgi:hypothetical protein
MIKLTDLLDEKLSPKAERIVKALKKTGKFKKNDPAMYAIANSRAEALDPVGKEDEDPDNDGIENTEADNYILHHRSVIAKKIEKAKANKKAKSIDEEMCVMCGKEHGEYHHHDHEASMAKGELRDMLIHGSMLYQLIQEGDELPGWVSAYITLASDYIHSVAEYLGEEAAETETYE